VAVVLLEVDVAILLRAVFVQVHVHDILQQVGHLARPMDLVLAHVDVLAQRLGEA